ncbi:MAG TPA: hypothetical protein VLH80_07305 [Nitrospiraceae bacterium]|nr:hypothetical protein [Nitrospiraceae bacterium]
MRLRTLRRLGAFFLLLALCPLAHATDLTVKCDAPTMGTDPTTGQVVPIPSDETVTFNLYGADQGSPLVLLTPTPLTTCLSVRTNVDPGTTKCYAWGALGTRNGQSAESVHTAPVCKYVPLPLFTPQPPTNPTVNMVTVATTVYMELQVPNGFSFLAVGTVPLGTACDPTQRVNDFYVIPASAVTWSGNIHRLAALAACSIN